MSQHPSPNLPAQPSGPTPSKAKLPRKKRWLRRLKITVIVIIFLAVALPIAASIMLPIVIRHTAARFGLKADYERQEMHFYSSDVGIYRLSFTDASGGPPLLAVDYCRANISTWDLLRGKLVIYRLEGEYVTPCTLRRTADGRFPLLDRLAAKLSSPAPQPAPAAKPTEIDFSSPFALETFRLNHVHLHYVDETVKPAGDYTLDTSLWLTDLKSRQRPTRMEFDLAGGNVLDSLHVVATGTGVGKNLDASLQVSLRGLHPRRAEEFLRLLNIGATSNDVSAEMAVELHTAPTTQPSCLHADLYCHGISITADGQRAAELSHVAIDADALGPGVAQIAKIDVDGMKCQLTRSHEGNFGLAGLEFLPPPAGAPAMAPVGSPDPVPAAAASPAGPPAAQPSAAPWQWSIGELHLTQLRPTFHDASVPGGADVQFGIQDLLLTNLGRDATAPTQLTATLVAPGCVHQILLTGTANPLAALPEGDLDVRAQGISLDALTPYFKAAGLECRLNRANLSCSLHAASSLDAAGQKQTDLRFANLRLANSDNTLLELDGVRVSGLKMDPATDTFEAQSVEISGPQLSAQRQASGALQSMGFCTLIGPSYSRPSAMAPTATAAPNPAVAARLPRLKIGNFLWNNIHFRYDDQGTAPTTQFAVNDAGVDIHDLLLDMNAGAPAAPPAHLHAWLKAPGLMDEVQIEGSLSANAGGSNVDLTLDAQGLRAAALQPYLQSTGIRPVMIDGSLHLQAGVALRQDDAGLHANLELHDLRLSEHGQELAGVQHFSMPDVQLGQQETLLGDVTIERPHLHIVRQSDGSLALAGVRLTKPAAKTSTAPSAPTFHADNAINTPRAASAQTTPPVIHLRSLHVADAALHWTDQAASKPVDLAVSANLDVAALVLGKPAAPARILATLAVPGCADKFHISGHFIPDAQSPAVHLDVDAAGLRIGPLAAYLPPGIEGALNDGRLRTTLDAAMQNNDQGGKQAQLILSDLDFRDGQDGPALLKLRALRLMLRRFDESARVIALDEVSCSSLETLIHKTASGQKMLGLEFAGGASAAPPAPAPPAAAADRPEDAPAQPQNDAAKAAAQSAGPGLAQILSQRRLKLWLLTLQKLDLSANRITVIDDTHAGGEPLVLSNLQLKNDSPIELLGDKPEERPPIHLEFACRDSAVADVVLLKLEASPFALEPHARLDFSATGVRGDALLASLPELRDKIDGHELTDGRLSVRVDASIVRIDRQDLLQGRFDRPFDTELIVKGLQWRNGQEGPLLAGSEEIRCEGIHINPAATSIQARSLEISNLAGHVERQRDGIHALGFILRTQPAPPTTAPATTAEAAALAPSTSPAAASSATGHPDATNATLGAWAASQPSAPAASALPAAAPKPPWEISIDKITASGMDFTLIDQCVDPPLTVPINSFDLEIHGLSTRVLHEQRPLRFSLLANTAPVLVAVPPREGAAPTSQPAAEKRDLLSQITASGNIWLYPRPKGWIKTSLSGLELAALRSEAQAQEISLYSGTIDGDVDVQFPGDGTAELRPTFVFDDLKMSEPPNGPIQRFFKLSAPLNVVIWGLQDASGKITIPLHFSVEQGNLNTGSLYGSAVFAISGVLGVAALSGPAKMAEAALGMAGIHLGGGKEKGPQPVLIPFAAGDATPGSYDIQALNTFVYQIQSDNSAEIKLVQELGQGDVQCEKLRANPSPEDVRQLADQWRQRKAELIRSRDLAEGQACAELAMGMDGSAAVERLRAIDRELARAEDATDDLYNMLRPGASRQAQRRTRAACLALAQERLDAVRQTILNLGGPEMAARVTIIGPQYNPSASATGCVGVTPSKKQTGNAASAGR